MNIKVVDQENKSITYGCDFAIVKEYLNEDNKNNQKILVRNKETNSYFWNLKLEAKNYKVKEKLIKDKRLWNNLREEYLKLKNNNKDSGKKSFTLYYEALNNVTTNIKK